ncbi:ribosome biogenesis GTP-binding protein YihA/YsxC [Rhodocytophaga aerolata]|uniref:Probable GTP-binding protein EngB n=1 Tax=Rhodocytophaga aerolata TaxID=455078 RepID=A0ABT8R673_9BACT|nr:ribosome biogenesis GTP-binding protein YihA/YsxC [Rhodocytophaga aerolata]MDO1446185.1 ribosome biogenesis GTP-binding protein YihA/YsxC [Rhodocytophaga aerolata]
MKIIQATFIQSNTDYKACPAPEKPEYAFIGRSNVGKSSLINMLTGHPNLAKTSQKPGKTQLINHFLINDEWYLVDLPGYGWAQASKADREKWDTMIRQYLLQRTNLLCVFVLIDSRHEAQKVDLEFMEWLGKSEIPFSIIFTKADKQTKSKTQLHVEQYIQKMLEQWEEVPSYFVTSSVSRDGRDEILKFIDSLNKTYKKI